MKKRHGKKLALHTETLRKLGTADLKGVAGDADSIIDVRDLPSWNSDCFWGTCGPNSCLGVCTLARCAAADAQ
jgi:hypothetical protein